MQKQYVLGIAAALVLALTACGKKQEAPAPIPEATVTPAPAESPAVTVANISLGSAIDSDKKVSHSADTFNKKDTIYASVDTTGNGTAKLKARWTYRKNGQEALVKEDTQTILSTGPATNEFHVSKPDGWPTGDYQVVVSIDDKSAGTKTFTVK